MNVQQTEKVFEFVNFEEKPAASQCNQCEPKIGSSDSCDAMGKWPSKRSLSFRNFDRNQIVLALNLFGFVAYLVEMFIDFLS